MTMEKGKIAKYFPGQGYGFIHRPGQAKDVFFRKEQLAQEGSGEIREELTVEFEMAQGKKGPMAQNVRIVPGTAAPSSPPPVQAIPAEIAVGLTALPETKFKKVPVVITVARGNEPVIGMEVKLQANDREIKSSAGKPFCTDLSGKVTILVALQNGEDSLALSVEIQEKVYSFFWSKPPATKGQHKPKKQTDIQVKAVPTQMGSAMRFHVTTTLSGETNLIASKIKLRSQEGHNFRARIVGSSKWKTGASVNFPSPGEVTIEVQWVQHIPGNYIIIGVEGTLNESGPHYVSGHCLAPITEQGATATTMIQ